MKRLPTVSRPVLLGSVIVLATLLLLACDILTRDPQLAPPTSYDLAAVQVNPFGFGVMLQSLVAPVVLLYLLGQTTLCRRYVGSQPDPRFSILLFGALTLIQVIALTYEVGDFGLNTERVSLGIVVLVVAGLLGGWRLGLAVGLSTMLIVGIRMILFAWMTVGFPWELVRTEGWLGLVRTESTFLALDSRVSAPLWAGLVSGISSELLGEHRFTPGVVLILGLGIGMGAGALATIKAPNLPGLFMLLTIEVLMSSAAATVVALVFNGTQAEAARRKAQAAELALARAELRTLRAQINPHFLFNALNTIRYSIRTDPEAARQLLLDLSEVFQRALRSGEFGPLRDEIHYVEAYLALEKARCGDRLHIECWWPEEEAVLDRLIPTLILQPLVENAVIHGIAPKPEGGTVRISVECATNEFVMRVEDNGVGIPPTRLAELLGPAHEGDRSIGLRNVDTRLRAIYGESHRLRLESKPERGTRVEFRVPLSNPVAVPHALVPGGENR